MAVKNTQKNESTSVKPCCVCKETRKARDDCYLFAPSSSQSGGDEELQTHCKKYIEAHSECLKGYGFNFD